MSVAAVVGAVVGFSLGGALLLGTWTWVPERVRRRGLVKSTGLAARPMRWELTWRGTAGGHEVRLVETHSWHAQRGCIAIIRLHERLRDGLELAVAHPLLTRLEVGGARIRHRDGEPVLEVKRGLAWEVDMTLRQRMRTLPGPRIAVRLPAAGTTALSLAVQLATALQDRQSAPLRALAERWSLTLSEPNENGDRSLHGSVGPADLDVQFDEGGWSLRARTALSYVARPGTGSSGNPVLDMLVAVRGPVPAGTEEAVLALVHGQGARIGPKTVRVEGTDLAELDKAIDALRGLACHHEPCSTVSG